MNYLILKEREVKENLIKIINTSGLPAFVLKAIIKDLWEQLNIKAEEQYKEAKKNKEIEKQIENLKESE